MPVPRVEPEIDPADFPPAALYLPKSKPVADGRKAELIAFDVLGSFLGGRSVQEKAGRSGTDTFETDVHGHLAASGLKVIHHEFRRAVVHCREDPVVDSVPNRIEACETGYPYHICAFFETLAEDPLVIDPTIDFMVDIFHSGSIKEGTDMVDDVARIDCDPVLGCYADRRGDDQQQGS